MGRVAGVITLLALLAACSSSPTTSQVRGTLREVGGFPPGINIAVRGRVNVATFDGRRIASVVVGNDGRFVIPLADGTYKISGSTPKANVPCGGQIIRVHGASRRATVVCNIM
jgi:hypothetical protein